MEFVLNDYRKNITDDELIEDIKRVAQMLRVEKLTRSEYDKYGHFSSSTIGHRFNGWNKALDKAGLFHAKEHTKRNEYGRVSNESLLNDLRVQAEKLGQDTITSSQYDEHGVYGSAIIKWRFQSWDLALQTAGLSSTGFHHSITDFELLKDIEDLWIKLGRQPTATDVRNGLSKYSLNSFVRHFGGWRNALKAFVEWVNNDDKENDSTACDEIQATRPYNPTDSSKAFFSQHTTRRDVNYRMRFLIMKRDNFKCCICGRSPAKDPSVELHIDHIVPWSKGGETTFDNLRTLCSKCNLGKSDLTE